MKFLASIFMALVVAMPASAELVTLTMTEVATSVVKSGEVPFGIEVGDTFTFSYSYDYDPGEVFDGLLDTNVDAQFTVNFGGTSFSGADAFSSLYTEASEFGNSYQWTGSGGGLLIDHFVIGQLDPEMLGDLALGQTDGRVEMFVYGSNWDVFVEGDTTFTATVPEPTTGLMFGSAMLAIVRRRKRTRA